MIRIGTSIPSRAVAIISRPTALQLGSMEVALTSMGANEMMKAPRNKRNIVTIISRGFVKRNKKGLEK